ncbi:MAG: nucleotidyltransferase family protein [Anaerolineales bacterium]|nr:nucleotidyltransferase family protein [Anaerolineales bacterium]
MAREARIDIPEQKLADFCRKWRVVELALFGSVLGDQFNAESDVDVLIDFTEGAAWDLFDLVRMQDELEAIFDRPVDLVEKAGLRNPFRRSSILRGKQVVYGPVGAG